MTCRWRWFIHPETAISTNRNGSSTLCVFKTHYRDCRAAVAKYRIFMQIQFSDHTRWTAEAPAERGDGLSGILYDFDAIHTRHARDWDETEQDFPL